jgi:hypothetical protein
MTCHHVQLPSGARAIVCTTQQRCVQCGGRADLRCDWKVANRRSGTCDKAVCSRCTHSPAVEKDLCPEHADIWHARRNDQGAA